MPTASRVSRRRTPEAGVDAYLAALSPRSRELASELRALIRTAAPEADETIKWGMPVYVKDGLVCYIRAREDHVLLGFFRRWTRLPDPERLLEGTGATTRHVKVRRREDLRPELFRQWIARAARP